MSDYLRVMGIDRWVLRQNVKPVLPACYAYELWSRGQRVGLLFAAATAEDSAVVALLEKMIAAIKCEARGCWYSIQPDCSGISDLRFVITLGDGFEVLENVPRIHSYSPQRLMTKPALKAETWQSLQTVFSLLPK